jgi:hypothetical protein
VYEESYGKNLSGENSPIEIDTFDVGCNFFTFDACIAPKGHHLCQQTADRQDVKNITLDFTERRRSLRPTWDCVMLTE